MIILFPFATLFSFVLTLSFGGVGSVFALVLGFAAVIAATVVPHEGDPAFFAMGPAPHEDFVFSCPAGVGRRVIVGASDAAGNAYAFTIASVAQAEGAALNA